MTIDAAIESPDYKESMERFSAHTRTSPINFADIFNPLLLNQIAIEGRLSIG